MRKIDKSLILSTKYKAWVEDFKDNNHDEYNSSKNKYYNDIKMSLLYCQGGLCAYSEKRLCDSKYFGLEHWKDGKYKTKLEKSDKNKILGDLEHFDESLKKKQAWLWSNFFVVDKHINCIVKARNSVKNILKPDSEDYDPYRYLEFDLETGFFIPLYSLSNEEQDDVEDMIDTLGLNCYDSDRKEYIQLYLDLNKKREAYQYPTAWKMTLENLKDEEET
jgi:hypothetical protein